MWNIIHNIIIFGTGVGSVYLTQTTIEELHKYASIVGLVGEPSMLYVTYKSDQWGMFFATWVYTGVWAYGFYINWIL